MNEEINAGTNIRTTVSFRNISPNCSFSSVITCVTSLATRTETHDVE